MPEEIIDGKFMDQSVQISQAPENNEKISKKTKSPVGDGKREKSHSARKLLTVKNNKVSQDQEVNQDGFLAERLDQDFENKSPARRPLSSKSLILTKTLENEKEETNKDEKDGAGPETPKVLDRPTSENPPFYCGLYYGTGAVTGSRNWYQGQSQMLYRILMVVVPLLVLSVLLNFLIWFYFRPTPKYFAVTPDLKVMEMPPLSEPVIGSQALLNWTAEVVTRALSLDFLHWRQKLMEARSDFEPQGFDSFVKSLESGGHLKKIEAERLNLSCVVSEAPVIVSSGLLSGKMTWKIEMPVLISYQSSTGVAASQKLLAEIVIHRTQTTVNPKGVLVKQIVLNKNS